MAEAVLTFFLQKLSTLITEEANLLQGVEEEVRLLQNELEWISLFMRGADEKRRSDPKVALWVKQLRQITFHAEDVIDEFILKVDQHGRQRSNLCGFVGSLKSCITCARQAPLLHQLGSQIKVINTMAEKISANQSKYCGEFSSGTSSSLPNQKLTRPPIAEGFDVVGFKHDEEKVLSLLVNEGDHHEDRRQLAVVSIVGMGGLGKTTLAKKVYNSKDVKEKFDCFAWVSVSQDYRLRDLLLSIIKCVITLSKEEKEKLITEDEDELGKKLREVLLEGDKKYLIVLDDIWKKEDWDVLKFVFPKTNGSRILLTTRNKDVAEHADSLSSSNIYELPLLDVNESWKLFLNKVFGLRERNTEAQESNLSQELKVLGEDMVQKCGGLPLAIVVLGGLLSSKEMTKVAWSRVNNNVHWELSHGVGLHSCSGILAFSYCDLPYYLKPCFMYMGLFPEDYEISASKLFKYWIAEGFVQKRGEENLEDIAEDYMKELIHRSMIQVGKWRYDGRVQSCRIHDLLRDLAIAESKEDHFSHQVTGNIVDFPKHNVRRLSFIGNGEDRSVSQICYTRCLRSLICYSMRCGDKQSLTSVCTSFKLLKVLDLLESKIYVKLPTAIGELIHLKYLGVWSLVIPHSISKLVNLQTLNIGLHNYDVDQIPSHIWSLRQLRHLKFWDGYHRPLIRCPTIIRLTSCQLGNLTNLQSLDVKFFGGINGATLGRLIMLRKLMISEIPSHKVKEIVDSIAKLTCLRSLLLSTEGEFPATINFSSNSQLTKLFLKGDLSNNGEILFPPNLIKITLSLSRMKTDQMVQALGKLQYLKFLELSWDAYIGKKMVLSQGVFLKLQVLVLCDQRNLEELIMEEGALISLTHLTIGPCRKLKMLPDGLRHLNKLEELRVIAMPLEFNGRLKENEGEDWDKIKHIPSVKLMKY